MADRKPTLVVRHGQLEDRQAVLDIDTDIYEGLDYLSARYDVFCKDPRRINYILEADGLPVAYFVATVVDDGDGAIFQAARTHPEHRQLGYYNYLKKAAAEELKVLYPNMKEVLYTSGSTSPNNSGIYSVGGARRILTAKPFRLINLTEIEDRLKLKAALEKQDDRISNVQKIEFSRLNEFLKKEDFRKLSFEDRLLIEWVPYKLDIPSNFSLSNRFPEFFLVSHDDQGLIDGVSFHSVFEDKDLERHDLEAYCDSEDALLKHSASFLQSVLESATRRNIYCVTLWPKSFDNTSFEATSEKTFDIAYCKERLDDILYIPLVADTGYFQ
ncbi:histidine N-acetyltransferase-like [Lineus longissimus]|uniref:histidine N-acetyltransferase-like n=1 Tax=Lineus longissimus TaxID=88925 RepID=UPI002B4D8846